MPESQNPAPSLQHRFLIEWLLLIALLLLAGGVIGYMHYQEQDEIVRNEMQRLEAQAHLFEVNLAEQLSGARKLMSKIIHDLPDWQRHGDALATGSAQVETMASVFAGISEILVTDAKGRSIISSSPHLVALDLSQREYFRTARERRDRNMTYVTTPFVTAMGRVNVVLVREITRPDGTFGGVVVAGLERQFFSLLLESLRYAPDVASHLAHGNGTPLVQAPPPIVGDAPRVLLTSLPRQHDALLVVSKTVRPAELMLDQPLLISISRKKDSVLANWKSYTLANAAMFMAVASITLILLGLHHRRQAHVEVALREQADERERWTRELARHARDLAEAQQIAQVGSWTLDLASQRFECSHEIARLFELDHAQAQSHGNFLAMLHPDDREVVRQAYAESLEHRAPYGLVHRLRMPDGRIKWVLAKGRSEFDAEGRAQRSMGTMEDISERVFADEQMRIAAAVFDSSDGMMITNANNVILRVNRAFSEISGYAPEELVGKPPSMLKSGRHNADFYRNMWEQIHRCGRWQGEVWDRRKNGEEFPHWLNISAVKDNAGVVTHYVATQHDITQHKLAEEKIRELAFYDQLTGLSNRTLLMDRLKQAMATGSRSGMYGAVLFIDLDNFKTLNDTLGHDMGDLLLQQVARRLSACVRAEDTLARLGGDEFIVMLTGLSKLESEAAAQVESAGEKVLASLTKPYQLNTTVYHSTPSIGATLFRGHRVSADDVLKQADLAMYKTKSSGRNSLRFFDPAMESAVMTRAALESDLRAALRRDEFLLHYQPQVDVNGALLGAEALLRWQHPSRGMVSPAEFIPLAEELGVIIPIGRWVLHTACQQLAKWAQMPGMSSLCIAVNVSARQFHQRDFVDEVQEAIEVSGANPRRLKLELTESLLVTNVEEIVKRMLQLKSLGISFSLDDFGTGYSSLTYLKRMPLDQLKIDQSFVRDILTDANDAAIARTVIALAHSLDLEVIAEGVETAQQRDFLARAGCLAYQGYFFSRPLALEAFEHYASAKVGAGDTAIQ